MSLDTLSMFKSLFKAIKSGSVKQQAEVQTRIYDSAIKDVEDKMFDRMSEIEMRFEKALTRNTIVNIIGISTPILFGFAAVVLAIIFK